MATILVVDDRTTNREFLVTLLGYHHHDLLQAADGAEALAVARANHPDLVITDVLMPTMDGYAFVRHLRADPTLAHTPVIFYTAAYLEREARALARDCGVEYVLAKPTEAALIVRTVAAALGQASGRSPPREALLPDTFDREHLRLLTDKLSHEVNELEAVNGRLAALIDVSQRLASERDPLRLLTTYCHVARTIVSAKYAAIGVLEDDGSALRHYLTSGAAVHMDDAPAALPKPESLLSQLLAQRSPLRLRGLDSDIQALGFPPSHPPIASFLGIPIASPTRVYGWLALADKHGAEEFGAEDEQIAMTLGGLMALAYENARRYEALQQHATALEQEVAERMRAEEALRESEERFRMLFEVSSLGIVAMDQAGRITLANPALETMFGYPHGELAGQPLDLLLPMRLRSLHTAHQRGYLAAPWTRPMGHDIDLWGQRKDGRVFPVEASLNFFHLDGQIVPVAFVADISERKRAARRQAMQIAVTRILAESDSRYEAVPQILEAICSNTDCQLGALWRVDPQASLLRWENNWHVPSLNPAQLQAAGHSTSIPIGSGLIGRVWASAQPEWLSDIAAGESLFSIAAEEDAGLRAAFAFPIRGGSDVLGVMVFYTDARESDTDLLSLLADIGSQVGQFFERKQAEQTLWQYTQRLKTLHAIDQAILAVQSPEAIAQAALCHIRQLIPCRHASVVGFDLSSGEAIVWAIEQSGGAGLQIGARLPQEGLLRMDALRQGQPLAVKDLRDPLEAGAGHLLQKEGLRSAIAVPLISQGNLIGALNLASDSPGAFTPNSVEIAREVGDQLAVAIQNARLFEQVRVGRERLQILSRQLVRAQEDERRRLAHELHDEIGQALTAAQLNLQTLLGLPDLAMLPARLEDSLTLIDRVLQQVRALSLDLRPSMLDDLGLVAALRWYTNRQAERAGLVVGFVADPPSLRLASEIETTCFRIAQEAMTNIIRHARARQVSVELRQHDSELRLALRDDGVGFDSAAARNRAAHGASLGLVGMQERALLIGGQVTIESAPGQGTEVLARFPLSESSAHDRPVERRKAGR